MIENIEQAKERLKGIVDFYKLNDPNNYDYNDRDLISMKLVLEEIERLKELCDKYEEEHKTTFETWQKDIKENEHLRTALNSKESIIKEVREYIQDRYDGEVLIHTFDKCNVGELLKMLDKGE